MEHAPPVQFKSKTGEDATASLNMLEAIGHAKIAVASMTNLEIDAIAQCQKREGGSWRIVVDVIESVARMGDNDLLATYEVQISPTADLEAFNRLRRYHREDRDQAAP